MKIRAELAISAPAQDAWVVVGERFGEIGEWASAIAESVMDGPPGEALFPGLTLLSPGQLIDLWFGPGPFRDQVLNWPQVVQAGLAALRHAAADTGDPEVTGLLRRAQTHAQVHLVTPGVPAESSPVICPVFD